jgi:cation:H+ antiporter
MIWAIVGLVGGLALLAYAADQFVVGAARLSIALRLSAVVVGAVVIGFGTSAPELLVSGLAAARGAGDLAIGNIVGSNVANLTLVLGIAALITPIGVSSTVLRREAPLSVGTVFVFAVLVRDGLTTLDGVLLAITLVVALGFVMSAAKRAPADLRAQVTKFVATERPALRPEIARTLIGLAGTVLGAQLLVASASHIAAVIGLDDGFVGLTVVAVGTSLPELATAVQAARRAETDLIVGNLLGSNLFNAGAVGAVVGFLGPSTLANPAVLLPAVALMLGVVAMSLVFMISDARVRRYEGALLLGGYLVAVPMLAG